MMNQTKKQLLENTLSMVETLSKLSFKAGKNDSLSFDRYHFDSVRQAEGNLRDSIIYLANMKNNEVKLREKHWKNQNKNF